jgi:hypothetical protein
MQGPASVVEALAVLAAIVTVHECGHFLAARLQNIHVTKFSIGFGPALLSYQVGLVYEFAAADLFNLQILSTPTCYNSSFLSLPAQLGQSSVHSYTALKCRD